MPQTLFKAMQQVETAKLSWRGCPHSICKQQQSCSGGPRGTCILTGGFTACSKRGHRMLGDKLRRREWVARKNSDNPPSITEIMLRIEEVKIERRLQLEEDGDLPF